MRLFLNQVLILANKKITSGIIWNGIQMVVNRSFSFVVKLILARILFPEAFGIVGMAAVFIALIKALNELGMGAALIQRAEEDLSESHFYTAFWTGLGWSLFMYLVIALGLGPLANWFYEEPILEELMPVLGLSVLLSPIVMIHKSKLTRAMNFKKLALINNASHIFAGTISIVLAFGGAGVWSLVFNSVAAASFSIPLFFAVTRWKPRFEWDKSSFRDVFGFGVFATGTSLVGVMLTNFDYLLIGKFVSAATLGAYTLAFVLTDTVRSQVMNVVNSVMYPVYSKSQNDHEQLARYYLNVVQLNALVVFPIMASLFVFAKPIILLCFGEEWIESVVLVQLLSVSVMLHMLVNSSTILIRGAGKPGLEFRIQAFKAFLIFMPSLFIGIYYYGAIGAAVAVIFNKLVSISIAQYYLDKLFGVTMKMMLEKTSGVVIVSVVGILFGWVVQKTFDLDFFINLSLFLAVYASLLYIFCGKIIREAVKKIRG